MRHTWSVVLVNALAQEIVYMTRAIGDEGRIGLSTCLRKPSATTFSKAQRMGDVFTASGLPPLAANKNREVGLTLMHELLNQRHEGVH
jgi:hypothetical protein